MDPVGRALDELDGDARTLLGLWCACVASVRGLIPEPPGEAHAAVDWWCAATERLAEGVPSALYIEPEVPGGPVLVRITRNLLQGFDAGLGPVALAHADLALIGDTYARWGDRDDRRSAGRFYTPAPWVQVAIEGIIQPGQTVFDPTCGGGRFLLAALDALAPGPPSPARAEAVEACLFGADLDPLAVALCQAVLHLASATPARFAVAAELNIEEGDPLLGLAAARLEQGAARDQFTLFAPVPQARPEPKGDPHKHRARVRGWRVRQSEALRRRQARLEPFLPEGAPEAAWVDLMLPAPFDVVVGNPPYRGGRLGDLSADDSLYREAFEVAEYQLDPYPLFMELGLDLLKPGGRLSMVVPDTWMSNLRAKKLRTLLLARHGLDRIIELPAEAFGAGVETAVVQATAEAGGPGHVPGRVPVLRAALDGEVPTITPSGALLPEPGRLEAPLALPRDGWTLALLEASRSWRTTLAQVAEITRGVNPYHHTTHTPEQIAERVHHADHKVDKTYVPELRGRALGPYRLWWGGTTWLSYGEWLKEPRDPRFFEGARLLIRKVIGETLYAAFTDQPLCCDQSVYIARLLEGQPWPPGFLLACLNSTLVARLIRAKHQEDDQLFPQIKVAELRRVPLPPVLPTDPAVAAIAQAAFALQALESARFEALCADVARVLGPEAPPEKVHRAVHKRIKSKWPQGDPHASPALILQLAEIRARRSDIEHRIAALYGLELPPDPATPSPPPSSTPVHPPDKERSMLQVGDALPQFELQDDHGNPVTSADWASQTVVLYFYPKDDTPGCTKESCDFRDLRPEFEARGALIYGISADDVASHEAFRDKYSLNFPLLADPTHGLCDAFGVWGEQSWQGHTYMGIARTTFVIKDGVIAQVYPDVNVTEHAAKVLAAL